METTTAERRAARERADAAPSSRARVRWARVALVVVAACLALGVIAQVLVAGLGVFAGAGWWPRHRAFVHAFQWLAPIALVLAYLARAARATKVLAWLAVALLWLQYTTAELRLRPDRAGWAALHPVGAMLLFWVATELARRAWRLATGGDASALA